MKIEELLGMEVEEDYVLADLGTFEVDGEKLLHRIEEVTPERAYDFMENQYTNNRNMRKTVLAITDDIMEDEFPYTGAAIRIDNKGKMFDGQHRLQACINANKSIVTLVIYGFNKDEILPFIDSGTIKTLKDRLVQKGTERPSEVSNALYHFIKLSSKRGESYYTNKQAIPYRVKMRIFALNQGLIKSADFVAKTGGMLTKTKGIHVCLHYMFSIIDEELADDFMEKIGTGVDLDTNDPRRLCRARFERILMTGGKFDWREKAAPIVTAWNLYMENREISKIQISRTSAPAKLAIIPKIMGWEYDKYNKIFSKLLKKKKVLEKGKNKK